MARRSRPSFRNPPIHEVVCGLQFRPLALFQAPHYGLFWQTIRKDFPNCRTVAPIGGNPSLIAPQEIEVSFHVGSVMPRVWFISADNSCLVQLQQDRFLFNWRAGDGRNRYPRYPYVIRRLQKLFGKFQDFLRDNELGEVSLLGTELSYINHVTTEDLGAAFPDFSWRHDKRYLPPADAFNFQTNHVMNDGWLHVAIMSAKTGDGKPFVRFDLTARGQVAHHDGDGVWHWYDEANMWVVDAFIDLTSDQMQREAWERSK
jgi:uncharacterized protein (TIGR04255 family)